MIDLIGMQLTRVERLQYVYKGEADPPGDDVHLWFGERVVRLRVGGNGQRLEVSNDAWVDPFAGDLDPVNAAYVATHGKFSLCDVSAEPGYASVIGGTLLGVERTILSDELRGIALRFEAVTMRADADGDELDVSWT